MFITKREGGTWPALVGKGEQMSQGPFGRGFLTKFTMCVFSWTVFHRLLVYDNPRWRDRANQCVVCDSFVWDYNFFVSLVPSCCKMVSDSLDESNEDTCKSGLFSVFAGQATCWPLKTTFTFLFSYDDLILPGADQKETHGFLGQANNEIVKPRTRSRNSKSSCVTEILILLAAGKMSFWFQKRSEKLAAADPVRCSCCGLIKINKVGLQPLSKW